MNSEREKIIKKTLNNFAQNYLRTKNNYLKEETDTATVDFIRKTNPTASEFLMYNEYYVQKTLLK